MAEEHDHGDLDYTHIPIGESWAEEHAQFTERIKTLTKHISPDGETFSPPEVSIEEGTNNPSVYDYAGDQAPLNIGVTGRSRAINIQSQTDSGALGSFGNIYWISAAGERYATVVGNSNEGDRDLAIYTKGEPFGSGDNSLKNRFQIKAGADQTIADFRNLNVLGLYGDSPDLEFKPETASDTRIWFNDENANRQFAIRRVSGPTPELRISGLVTGGDFVSFADNGTQIWADFEQTMTRNVVWDSGTSRPSTPEQGERFFDSNLGQPIWYNGSAWVDAQGNVV